jgi:protein-S-isoprenylcysteine O-methyltransferase Ste14
MPPVLLLMALTFLARDSLLGRDFGTHYVLLVPCILSLACGITIARRRKKHLRFGILSGVPELSEGDGGRLLTEGIYASIRHPRYVETVFIVIAYALFANYLRHPRYVETVFIVIAYALFANYLGAYVVVALSFPAIYLIVLLEERELVERFGREYEDYCRRVPRFVPRLR